MKDCIDCGGMLPIKSKNKYIKRCNKCRYIKYGKSTCYKTKPHIDKTIAPIKDCLLWVEEKSRRNYNVDVIDLYKMVGIYEGLGGQMRCLDDYDTTIQLDMMWQFIFKEYNFIKSGGDDYFERNRIKIFNYFKERLKRKKAKSDF